MIVLWSLYIITAGVEQIMYGGITLAISFTEKPTTSTTWWSRLDIISIQFAYHDRRINQSPITIAAKIRIDVSFIAPVE